MKSLLFVLLQLTLVSIVYAFAYRAGYRSAQSKAMSVVRKFADPVTCLLDQLRESEDEAVEDDQKPEEANLQEISNRLPRSKGQKTNIESARGGQASNVE